MQIFYDPKIVGLYCIITFSTILLTRVQISLLLNLRLRYRPFCILSTILDVCPFPLGAYIRALLPTGTTVVL